MQNEKVILRRLRLDDANIIQNLANNINIYSTTLNIPYPYTIDDAKYWLKLQEKQFEEDRAYNFAIINQKDKSLVGVVGISRDKSNKGELGYWIGEEYWGNGFASSASELLIDYVFNDLSYNRVYSKHFAINPASGKVMQKLHMQYEGLLKSDELKDDVYHDILLYGLCKEDYLKIKKEGI